MRTVHFTTLNSILTKHPDTSILQVMWHLVVNGDVETTIEIPLGIHLTLPQEFSIEIPDTFTQRLLIGLITQFCYTAGLHNTEIQCPLCQGKTLHINIYPKDSFHICPNLDCHTSIPTLDVINKICMGTKTSIDPLYGIYPELYDKNIAETFEIFNNLLEDPPDAVLPLLRVLLEYLNNFSTMSLTKFINLTTVLTLPISHEMVTFQFNDSLTHAYFKLTGDLGSMDKAYPPEMVNILSTIISANWQTISSVAKYKMLY